MPRAGRLTSAADFRRTYADGRKAASKTVVVHVHQTGEDRPPRVAVSAGRGVGGAVQRNRAKRRLREAVRPLRSSIAPGQDVVFVATAAALVAEFQELVDSARATLAKAGAPRA